MLTFTCFDSHNTNPLTYFDRYTCLQDCYRTRKSKKVGSSLLLYFFKKVSFSSMSIFIVELQIHQIVSPISRIPNLRIFPMNIYYDLFLNWQIDKKKLFWTNKKFVFFFNWANWEKSVEKNSETSICKNI